MSGNAMGVFVAIGFFSTTTGGGLSSSSCMIGPASHFSRVCTTTPWAVAMASKHAREQACSTYIQRRMTDETWMMKRDEPTFDRMNGNHMKVAR